MASGCATTAGNSKPFIKEVSIKENIARVHFQPGPIKYVAEYNGKQTTLIPSKAISSWGEGYVEGAMLHSFRSLRSENGDYDELWMTAKNNNLEEGIEIKLSCFFQDGSITVKKLRVTKGAPRLISIGNDEALVALQPNP